MCSRKKLLGMLMTSMGIGMLVVIFIPHWGFVAAAVLVLCGIWLFIN